MTYFYIRLKQDVDRITILDYFVIAVMQFVI